MTDFGDTSTFSKGGDTELQDFLMAEKQKAQFNAQVRNLISFVYVTWCKLYFNNYIY